jgi:hypothetical protein
MRDAILSSLGAFIIGMIALPASTGAQGAASAAFVLSKTAAAAEVTNDQRVTILPPAGQTFFVGDAEGVGRASDD